MSSGTYDETKKEMEICESFVLKQMTWICFVFIWGVSRNFKNFITKLSQHILYIALKWPPFSIFIKKMEKSFSFSPFPSMTATVSCSHILCLNSSRNVDACSITLWLNISRFSNWNWQNTFKAIDFYIDSLLKLSFSLFRFFPHSRITLYLLCDCFAC